jgi:DNA-nicking Smr family endonuclease
MSEGDGDDEAGSAEDADAIVLPVTGELDLHTFAPREATAVVADYLDECRRRGLLEVRIVHGRGRGVRRAEVRRALAARADVVDFHDAPPTSGGWGATLVVLAPLGAE